MAIITIIITVPIIVLAIFLLNGKGAFLIAGYNTMSKKDKEGYNEKALCRFVGYLLIGVAACILLFPLGDYLKMAWISYTGMALMFTGVLAAAVYANTSKRFRKATGAGESSPAADSTEAEGAETPAENSEAGSASGVNSRRAKAKSDPMAANSKLFLIITATIGVIVFITVSVITILGAREPVVSLSGGSIQIKAMYGLTVDLKDITAVNLMPESMSDIGAGSRTDGYGGFGDALKGNFTTTKYGDALLFVRVYSAPTLRIDRAGGKPIFISFRESADTVALYNELSAFSRNQR